MFFLAPSYVFWYSIGNDFERSTFHAILSVFLCSLCLEYNFLKIQQLNVYLSLGYFLADLQYVITRKQHPSFLVHHVISIYALYLFTVRHSDTLLYSKLMLIEFSNPFMNMYLANKECKIKWAVAGFVFFIVRLVYFPAALVLYVRRWDEMVCGGTLLIGNIWWFWKHTKRIPKW